MNELHGQSTFRVCCLQAITYDGSPNNVTKYLVNVRSANAGIEDVLKRQGSDAFVCTMPHAD